MLYWILPAWLLDRPWLMPTCHTGSSSLGWYPAKKKKKIKIEKQFYNNNNEFSWNFCNSGHSYWHWEKLKNKNSRNNFCFWYEDVNEELTSEETFLKVFERKKTSKEVVTWQVPCFTNKSEKTVLYFSIQKDLKNVFIIKKTFIWTQNDNFLCNAFCFNLCSEKLY